jgi:hypothetical protein
VNSANSDFAVQTLDLSRKFGDLKAVDGDFLFLVGWAVAIFAIGVILFQRSMRS